MIFNFGLIREIRQRDSIRRTDLAKVLGVTDNYLYRLERGTSKPSLALIQRFSRIMSIPVEKLLSEDAGSEAGNEEGIRSSASILVGMKTKLDRERHEHGEADKRVLALEQRVEHLTAVLALHMRTGDIMCRDALSASEKMKKLEELARVTAKEGEISFNELLVALRVRRSVLRNWLSSETRPYKCRFAEGEEVMASTPGEAALRLRCFDCAAFESGECPGHGNEKRPENIITLIVRLEANGITKRAEQSRLLEECYGVRLTPHEISEMVYRNRHGTPIPEGVFNMETMRPKREKK